MSRKKIDVFTRLLNKIVINETTDCWEWQGGTNNIGYGFKEMENECEQHIE